MAITQLLSLSSLSQWGIKQTAVFENNMTSVERVLEYTTVDSECDDSKNSAKGASSVRNDWPSNGGITFRNVSLSYNNTLDYALNDINLEIRPKAKIGIVGRTGAGKSSILQAIFRLVDYNGAIEIDGIDTQSVAIHELRKRISVIPQNPVRIAFFFCSN